MRAQNERIGVHGTQALTQRDWDVRICYNRHQNQIKPLWIPRWKQITEITNRHKKKQEKSLGAAKIPTSGSRFGIQRTYSRILIYTCSWITLLSETCCQKQPTLGMQKLHSQHWSWGILTCGTLGWAEKVKHVWCSMGGCLSRRLQKVAWAGTISSPMLEPYVHQEGGG